jgi:excisionase family DNA binding protein
LKPEPYRSFDELPLVLSVPEMAAVLGISRTVAYDLARSKGFPSIRIGTRLIIPKENLMEWIQEQLQKKEAL